MRIDMKSKFIVLVILLILCLSSMAMADDAVFKGEGETVWPVESKEIEMVAETVLVEPGEDGWNANCIFILKNTGEATEVQVGFPDLTLSGPGYEETEVGTIKNFRCFVDGEEIQVGHKKGIRNPLKPELEYPFAYVWKMSFQKGETRRVVNTYSFKGTIIAGGETYLTYVLRTGSLWKGKIGVADVTFNLGKHDPNFTSCLNPPGYLIEEHKVRWIFNDFEPMEDIKICLRPFLQQWYSEVAKYGETDSVEILRRLLEESDWLWEKRHVLDYECIEKLINQLSKYQDVAEHRMKLVERKKEIERKHVAPKLRHSFKEMQKIEDLSPLDQEQVLKLMSIAENLEDFEMAKDLAQFLLKDVEIKLSKLQVITDSLARKPQSYKLEILRADLIEKINIYDLKMEEITNKQNNKLHLRGKKSNKVIFI